MRAAMIRDGEVLVDEHPDPEPGQGEVLVRVRGAGINGGDIHQRAGRYPAPPGSPPDIPGMELAGEVVARGPGADRFAEGERVFAIVGAGAKTELNLLAVMGKRLRLMGSTLRPRPLEEKAIAARAVEREVLPAVAAGTVRVPVSDTFPLDEVAAAYGRFEAGGKLGKIVLMT